MSVKQQSDQERPSVLVTRPEHANQPLVGLLSERDIDAVKLPCMAIVPLAPSQNEREIGLELDRYSLVVVVSANAARIGIDQLEQFWLQWPVKQYWAAIGKTSLSMLEAANVPLLPKERQLGASSEELWACLSDIDWSHRRVLIVRGQGGREWLGDRLQEGGARVDYYECYQRTVPTTLADEIKVLGKRPALSAILASSGQTLENLTQGCKRYGDPWLSIPLVVPSERVAELARSLGWSRVYVADDAYDESMVKCVEAVLASEFQL